MYTIQQNKKRGVYGRNGGLSKHCAIACNEASPPTPTPVTVQLFPPASGFVSVTAVSPVLKYPPPVAESPKSQLAVDVKPGVSSSIGPKLS